MGEHHFGITTPMFYDDDKDIQRFGDILKARCRQVNTVMGAEGIHAYVFRLKDFDHGITTEFTIMPALVAELTNVLKHGSAIVIAYDEPQENEHERQNRWFIPGRGIVLS